MELKKVVSEETKYVTKKNIDEKTLKKNIPNKWRKVGITAVIFSMIMKSKMVLAVSEFISIIEPGPIAGGFPVQSKLAGEFKLLGSVTLGTTGILAIMYYFIKKKKDLEKLKNFKNIIITLLVVAIILCALGFLIEYFY